MEARELANEVPPPGVDPWMYHMRRGNFAAAWEICDDILRQRGGKPCAHLPRHEQWIWSGSPLDGQRVLIRCYHGLGDTLMFIRFARWVKAIAREVIVWAQPALLPVLATVDGIDRLLPLHDGAPETAYDVDVESMELAHVFRVTPDTVPREIPYLHVPPRGGKLRQRDGKLHVGIVWQVGNFNLGRSMPLPSLEPLMHMPEVVLHALQRGPAADEWPDDVGVKDGTDDVLAVARLMHTLDLVISVDSFPVHLAGAMALPVWVPLEARADWRWMDDRVDSPWYPTARLFRQTTPGDWDGVGQRLAGELRRLHAAL